jgi:parallel beta-helix repeat protein
MTFVSPFFLERRSRGRIASARQPAALPTPPTSPGGWRAAALTGLLAAAAGGCGDGAVAPEPPLPAAQLVGASLAAVAPTMSGLVEDLWVASGREYVVAQGLAANALAYIDHGVVYQSMPAELREQTYIRTANADRTVSGNNQFLTFRLGEAATVYIAYNGTQFPAWLTTQGFANTGQTLVVGEGTYRLWSRVYAAAQLVQLGSNRPGTPSANMYTVIVRPTSAAPPPPDFGSVVRGIRPRGFGQGSYTLLQPAAGGTTYWVATNGNDSNAGSKARPFRTINRAAQVAAAGDVVTIRSGTYDETVEVLNSGTQQRRIVFQAEQRGAVVLGGSRDKRFTASGWNGGLRDEDIRPGVWVTLRGLVFQRTAKNEEPNGDDPEPAWKAAVGASRGWRIEDCWFDDAGHDALMIRGSHVEVVKSTFENNWTHAFLAGTGIGPNEDADLHRIGPLLFRDLIIRNNHTRPVPIGEQRSTKVLKVTRSIGAVVDNVESHGNRGPGWWFDRYNKDYEIRTSYFHSNTNSPEHTSDGRGLYLEVNSRGTSGGGIVENNVFADNQREGLTLANSERVRVRGNLFVNNGRCIHLSDTDRGGDDRLFDITIENNYCKAWTLDSAIHTGGARMSTPGEMEIIADGNTYDPGARTQLSFWSHQSIRAIHTIEDMRLKLGWESTGRIAPVNWPVP